MKLTELIKQTKETKDEFFARSYWTSESYVFVFKSQKDRESINSYCEIWSCEKARKYVASLESEDERAAEKNKNE